MSKSTGKSIVDRLKTKKKANANQKEIVYNKPSTGSAILSNLKQKNTAKSIGVDTLSSDLTTLTTSIDNAYKGWQTRETMDNTLSSVKSMYDRLGKYQDYSGTDLTELRNSLNDAITNLSSIKDVYNSYKSANAFNIARRNAQLGEQFKGLSYDDVQAEKKKYSPDSEEYHFLNRYTNYSNLKDFDKALADKKNVTPDKYDFMRNHNSSVRIFDKVSPNKPEEKINPSDIGFESADEYNNYIHNLETGRNKRKLDYAFDLYEDYLEKDDFESGSKYTQKLTDNDIYALQDTSDVVYEYLNNPSKRKEITDSITIATNGTSVFDADLYERLHPEEIRTFNYIYNKEGNEAANKFLKDMEVTLSKREYDEKSGEWKSASDGIGGGFLHSALSIPASLVGGISSIGDNLNSLITGSEYNPYSPANRLSNYASDVRENVGENISNATEGIEIFGQNIPSFLYQTGMSVFDNIAGASTLGPLYMITMSSNAFQQKAKEMTEAGESQSTVFATALSSALAEYVFEKISFDRFMSIKGIDTKTALLKTTLAQAGVEASEETFTELANMLSDKAFRGYSSEFSQYERELKELGYSDKEINKKLWEKGFAQVFWATVGGGLSGAAMGSVGAINNYNKNSGMGADIRSKERVQDLIDLVGDKKIGEAYETYSQYAKKGINADNIKDAQLGRLYHEAKGGAVENIHGKNATDETIRHGFETLGKLGNINTENTVKKTAKENAKKYNVAEASGVDVKNVEIKDGKVSIDEKTPLSNKDAELLGYAEVIAKEHGDGFANLFISQYDGNTDIDKYVMDFNLASQYVEDGFTLDYIIKNKGSLSATDVSNLYKETVIRAAKERKAKFDNLVKEMADKNFYKGFVDDSAIDYENKSTKDKINWKDLTEKQRDAVVFIKGFAQATGMNIQFVANGLDFHGSYDRDYNVITLNLDNMESNVKNIKDAVIPTMSHETTHWMKEKSPILWENLNKIVFSTLVDHYNSNTDLLGKSNLLRKLNEYYSEDKLKARTITEADLIQAEVNRLKKNSKKYKGKNVSNSDLVNEAREEIIARACEDMLSMSNEGRRIFNSLSEEEKKTLVGKFKELINNLVAWIDKALGNYKSTSTEVMIMRQYKDKLQRTSQLWDAMLKESVKVNQALEKSGKYKNNASDEKNIRYDIREEYVNEIDTWEKDGMPEGETFILGTTGDVLQGLGAIESDIYMRGDKIKEILNDHPEMTIDEIKKIPQILENPVLILKSQNVKGNPKTNTRLVVFGNIKAQDGKPILSVLDLRPKENNFVVNDMQKVSSAYTKDSNPVDFVEKSLVVYVDKKRTTKLLKSIGFQMPIELQQSGYIGSISYFKRSVNINGEEFPKVFKKGQAVYSEKNIDSEGNTLSKGQIEFYKNSKARDSQGRLLNLYHGTASAGFRVFNTSLGKYGGNWFTTSRADADSYAGNYKHKLFNPNEKDDIHSSVGGNFVLNDEMRFDSAEDLAEFKKKNPGYKDYLTDSEINEQMKNANDNGNWDEYDKLEEYQYSKERMAIKKAYDNYEWEHSRYATIGELIDNPDAFSLNDVLRAYDSFDRNNVARDSLEDGETKEDLVEGLRMLEEEAYEEESLRNIQFKARLNPGESGTVENFANNRTYACYVNAENPYEINADGNPLAMNGLYAKIERGMNDSSYDSVIVRNARVGAHQKVGDIVIIKKSNQAKLTSNLNPTNDKDIRFSEKGIDAEYLELAKNPEKNEVRIRELVDEAAERVFSNSKVRGNDGKLRLVYHGRVSDFTVFDRQFANVEGDFGKGYYFTSNEYDVDSNYANEEGPDLKNKISRYAEQLEWQDEYSGLSYEEREDIARQKFITSEPNTITAYLNMENPVYITPNEEGTFLDFNEEYDEETDEYGEPEGLLIDFVEALQDISKDYAYNDVDFSFIYEYAYGNGGAFASDIVKTIKHRIVDELTDDNGDLAINEVIRLAFEQIGFDGIVDTSVYYKFRNMKGMDSGTTHYIVFDSNQIKSADLVTYDDDGNIIPLSQRFNTENEDIRYSEKDYSYESMIAKPDMKLTVMDGNVPNNRADIIHEAKKKAAKIGKVNAKDKTVSVFVDDIERDVVIGTDGLKHSLNRGKRLQNKPIGIVTLNAGEILKNSIRINELTPSKESANGSYVLIGASKDINNNLYIVRFVVNEYGNELSSMDILYAINTKKESVVLNAPRYANNSLSETDSTISIAKLLDYVNKYFSAVLPESVLKHYGYEERPKGEFSDDALYSDKDISTEYIGYGEDSTKEIEKLKADIENLRKRLTLEKKITGGNEFNRNQLGAVARHLRKITDSNMDNLELMKELRDLYSYIAAAKELAWDEVWEKSMAIADKVLKESTPVTVTDDYAKKVLKHLQSSAFSLDETQKKEAQYIFDKHWNRNFMGKVKVKNDAPNIDTMWQEWAGLFPDIFEADIGNNKVKELYDIIEALRSASESIDVYSMQEKAKWLAYEIYNQYWNVSPIKTTADKYNEKIKALESKHRVMMREIREKHNEDVEAQKLVDDMYYKKKLVEQKGKFDSKLAEQRKTALEKQKELYKKLKERHDVDVAIAKQHGKDMMSKYKENAERKTVMQSIMATITSLNKKFEKNDKDVHIPEALKPVVANLISAIDYSSKQLLGMDGTKKDSRGTPTKKDIALDKKFARAKSMANEGVTLKESIEGALKMFQDAEKVANNTSDGSLDLSLVSLDVDLIDRIESLIKSLGVLEKNYGSSYTLQQMELDHLKTLNATVKSISNWASKIDNALSMKHKERISQIGEGTVDDCNLLGENQQYIEAIEGFRRFFTWSNLTPVNAFKRLGKNAMKVFDSLRDAQDNLAFHKQEILDFTAELFKGKLKDINKWRTEVKEFKLNLPDGTSKTVRMPVSYVMTLYCLAKQEDAQRHLLGMDEEGNRYEDNGGGMTIKPFKDGKLKVSSDVKNTILTKSSINQITSTLTDEQKAIADKLQEFLGSKGSEWCDKVSMALYGIKKFNIENYFPITVSPTTIKVLNPQDKRQSIHFFSILNYGFTKSRNPNAKQSVEIGDVFDIFANHMSMAAIYSSYALPIYDTVRWFNYKGKNLRGDEYGVNQAIQTAFGDVATTYIGRLISDLNGQHESSRLGFVTKIFRNTKLAMVGNSLSVALIQPTAYLKAMTKIPTRYLLRSALYVKDFGAINGIRKAKKWCGIALWKSQGNFDTDISNSTQSQMLHDEKWHEKAKSLSLKGAEWMDEFTWGMLWNACEFEVRANRKDLEVGSEEFYETIAYKLRDVIYETQVVDSPLTRSDIMRSPDNLAKMLTMFGSEITVAYNMVSEAFVQAKLDVRKNGKKGALKRNSKNIAIVMVAYTLTSAANAILNTMVQLMRDDEDKEPEEIMKMYFTNFLSDWLIFGKIPYVKEYLNSWQGYSSSRPDTLWMDSSVKSIKYFIKAFDGKEGYGEKAIKEALKSLSYLSGLPMYNLYRDVIATLDTFKILDAEDFKEMIDDIFN